MYRQGDVILRAHAFHCTSWKSVKKVILAEGEKTGHMHVLEPAPKTKTEIEMYERNGVLYLKTSGSSIIKHQEHKPIAVPSGTYKVIKQKELAENGVDNRYIPD